MKKIKAPRIMLAAPKSGSGKTLITCSLLAALKIKGIQTEAFKSGPDYIDPMFHKKIIEIPSRNLDTFFSEGNQIRSLFMATENKEEYFSVVEGAMGLFDGLGGIKEDGSAYNLARELSMPVILIVDAHGTGRSIIPLLAGFKSYDRENLIKGVILNKITSGFYEMIRPEIEKEVDIQVLGYFAKQKDINLESRHLGLKLPGEIQHLREDVERAGKSLIQTVDLDKIIKIGQNAAEIIKDEPARTKDETRVRIAVARDEAFCFYYEDNLRLLRESGAELVEFSPIRDKELPENIHGIILGGGYPELVADKLEKNETMKKAVRKALIEEKIPSLAECGGFMYLHEKLIDGDKEYSWCGVVDGECYNTGKLGRFGYISIWEKESTFMPEGQFIKAHEFHYYDSSNNGSACNAVKPTGTKSWDCVHKTENNWWGYPHLYYPSNPEFVQHFINVCKKYKESKISV